MLQVTPNGPHGKDVHPAVPVSLTELLVDVEACLQAGARGVHLHPRDRDGRECLAPREVNTTVAAVRDLADRCGAQVEIGLTTGAWIVPDVVERVRLISDWEGVDCATVNLCEPGFADVMAVLRDNGIGVDVGLWDISEIDRFARSGFVGDVQRVSIELDPGEPYFPTGRPESLADELDASLDAIGCTVPRLTHGAASWTWALVRYAFARGHDTRVGFEDSAYLPDGSQAASNAQLVTEAMRIQGSVPR